MSASINLKRRRSEDNETDSSSKQFVSDDSQVADCVVSKALEVIGCEFRNELRRRERDLYEIDEKLKEALRVQHLLRYAVVSSYYGMRTSQGEWPDASNSRQVVHPAIAGLSRKKKPKRKFDEALAESGTCDSDGPQEEKGNVEDDGNLPTKIPCYIPPASKKTTSETTSPTRGFHTKEKYCIIVGNVSRWIPVDCREDGASHKWMVYARCPPNATPISHFVSKVRFFLHSSYRPFDVVEVVSPPFRLSRRGWGEFPIRVQVHFCNPLNKPIDIIHHLVLDRTKSGRQALGAETVVEGWIFVDDKDRNECGDDVAGQQNNGTWEENSQEDGDDGFSDAAVGSSDRSMGESSRGSHTATRGKGQRDRGMPWSSSENMPSVFNECTLMSDDDIKKETVEEESNSSDDDVASSSMNCPNVVIKMETSEDGQNFGERNGLIDRVSIKEEPVTDEEQDVEEEFVLDHNLGKEEVVLCDITQECAGTEEEVVIEDGCFPGPSEEGSVVDLTSCHALNSAQYVKEGMETKTIPNSDRRSEQSKAPKLKVENCVNNFGDGVSLLASNPVTLKLATIVAHGETKPLHKLVSSSSAIKSGPPKGTSLLKSSSIRPGTSLLIACPTVASSAKTSQPKNYLMFKSTQPAHLPIINATIKPSVDQKTAIFAKNYSKLKNRVHDDQEAAASHLLRALPIVTSTACDPAYKALHQYAGSSLDEFFSWPLAKQRASEWIRANEVRKLLSAQGFSKDEDNAWTTKDIMMWARLRGYTPLSPKVPHAPLHFSPFGEHSPVALNTTTTFSEPKFVNNWLSSFETEKMDAVEESDDEEIDVVSIGGLPKKPSSSANQRIGLGARAAGGHKVILLGMELSLTDLSRLVDEFSRKIGVIASCPEEIAPCVFYPAAQRVLIEAVKSFMNDLVRGSYSYALRRISGSSDAPLTIKVEDVRNAVLNRQEFDILTNEGLSAEPDDSMKWDGPV